jgi:tetratricopeptide (TPR) repeat protein
VNGKKLELSDKSLGNYILTLTTQEPETNQRAYSTVNFSTRGEGAPQAPWEVDEPEISKDVENGVLDQQRGLCLIAQGHADEGRRWLRNALRLNKDNEPAREALVGEYYSKQAFTAVVALYNDAGVTESTDSQTIVRIANSLQRTGESLKAISLLQNALDTRAQDGSLYLGLSDIYKQQGNASKAAELEKQGLSFIGGKSN